MPEILFNAFSFLQKKLKANGFDHSNVTIDVPENHSVIDLIKSMDLDPDGIEAVFVNGKAGDFEYIIKDKDRIALIPPGTPGPHRLLLGIRPGDPIK
ncbi:MAG: MoaD/ThiS family protein [Desulfobacterales bacterium]|nr:MoaD/ThiS family protein [Desulfobacterales bacterium]